MRALRLVGLSLGVWSAVMLSACGGGSTHSSPPAPVFTSTPGTAASQGVAYSYQPTATDPAGGTVSFALTSGRGTAVLSGGTLKWTPAPAQSRVANNFTITATTSEGGSAAQSWAVTPTGTITVSTVDTLWAASGPQSFPAAFPAGGALVPNSDGSITVLPGSFTSPGTFSIPNVPAGYYWLAIGLNLTNVYDAFWTSSSAIDYGRDNAGPPKVITSKQSTTFNFNLSGLEPTAAQSWLAVSADTAVVNPAFVLQPTPGSTTLSATDVIDTDTDWSRVETLFLAQYAPVSLGGLNSLVLGTELTVSNPGFTEGGTNAVTETLQPTPQATLNVNVPGSQWARLISAVGPAPATVSGSWLSVSAEPFVTGGNQSPNPFGFNLPQVTPTPFSQTGQFAPDFCLNGSVYSGFLGAAGPAFVTDQNLGALDYGDPFPSSWAHAVAFCQEAQVPISVVGSPAIFPFAVPSGVAVAASSSASLAPMAAPVQNPTINGVNLFTMGTLNTTAVTLSWTAPANTNPFGYRISVFTQQPIGTNGVEYASVGVYGTAKTSAMLPPLTAGNTYVFVITTAVDGAANMETSPWRSALPTAFANVVSAPITIASGATTPAIHGDVDLFEKLFRRTTGKTCWLRSGGGSSIPDAKFTAEGCR
jgi:hypothetical protein